MTVAAAAAKAGPFTGNDVTSAFDFEFRVFADTDIRVVQTVIATGVESDLILNTDYTVSRNADQDLDPGGTVTYKVATVTTALPSTKKLTIVGNYAYEQPADIPNGGKFYASVVEAALDRLTMLLKQLLERVNRAFTLPVSVTADVSAEVPIPESNKVLAWNEAATALQNVDAATLATISAYGTAEADLFTGDGATTTFVLTSNPGAINNLGVSVGGVAQRPGVDYTWDAGTNITFTTAPPTGVDNILVRYARSLPQGSMAASAVTAADGAGGTLWSTTQEALDTLAFPLTDYTALRAYTGTRHTTVRITGVLATAYPQGIVGLFQLDATDTTSADNDGTIIVDASGRRWKRVYDGAVNIKWFGAIGDDVADDTVSVQKAFRVGKGLVYGPTGVYKITGTVEVGHTGGVVGTQFGVFYGDGPGFTRFNCALAGAAGFSVANWSIRDMKVTGRGRTSGFGETGISYLNNQTVRDNELFNVHADGFDVDGVRLSSAYNGIIELGRFTNCGTGVAFDNTGPWALGTTTYKLASSYFASCDLGFVIEGSGANMVLDLVTAEFCTQVADISNAAVNARRFYREGNTSGVGGVNVLRFADIAGTKQTAGDQDTFTYFIGSLPTTRGTITEFGAPQQNLTTGRGGQLSQTFSETASSLFHEWPAFGTETGLRSKFPLATMRPFIALTGYVLANGTQYSGDNYGLTVTKTGTGRYEILWNVVTFNNQTARYPVVELTANEGAEAAAANPFNISYFNKVSTPGNFTSFGASTGVTVVTRQWNGTTFVDADCAFSFNILIRLGTNSNEIPYFNLFGRNAT